MSSLTNRFEASDKRTRKRHNVVLSPSSSSSLDQEIFFDAKEMVHTEPSSVAVEEKKKRIEKMAQEKIAQEKKENEAINVPTENDDAFVYETENVEEAPFVEEVVKEETAEATKEIVEEKDKYVFLHLKKERPWKKLGKKLTAQKNLYQ